MADLIMPKRNKDSKISLKDIQNDFVELEFRIQNTDQDVMYIQESSGRLTTDKTLDGAINELFTLANNGKKNWAEVIGSPLVATDTFGSMKSKTQTLKNTLATNISNKGVTASGAESLSSLASKVSSILLNAKSASGIAMPQDYFVENVNKGTRLVITNLTFTPKLVFCISTGTDNTYVKQFSFYSSEFNLGGYGRLELPSLTFATSAQNYITTNGFCLQVNTNVQVKWYALE